MRAPKSFDRLDCIPLAGRGLYALCWSAACWFWRRNYFLKQKKLFATAGNPTESGGWRTMAVHMSAAPYGCGRDLYIFMRPEMVNGKVWSHVMRDIFKTVCTLRMRGVRMSHPLKDELNSLLTGVLHCKQRGLEQADQTGCDKKWTETCLCKLICLFECQSHVAFVLCHDGSVNWHLSKSRVYMGSIESQRRKQQLKEGEWLSTPWGRHRGVSL